MQRGSLVWTPEGPSGLERLVLGTMLVGVDPDTFTRRPLTLLEVAEREAAPGMALWVGGRLLVAHPTQGFPVFDVEGTWTERPASDLRVGNWLAVDRRVPTPTHPVALPEGDVILTVQLDADTLALTDALHAPEPYFAEMDKRALRLRLFELSGYVVGAGEVIGPHLTLVESAPDALGYYREAVTQLFGEATETEVPHRLHRWLGAGLNPPFTRTLPDWVWQLDHPARAAFLRGLFDGRGVVSAHQLMLPHLSSQLLVEVQALLGMVGVESCVSADEDAFSLTIRNVRRFAEWVYSNVAAHAALLRVVYAKEPRYPDDESALLPLRHVRPALARIRAAHALPRRTADRVDERELARLDTLRLLATAFDDAGLRTLVNQQLHLEPIAALHPAPAAPSFALTVTPPLPIVANGVVVGGI